MMSQNLNYFPGDSQNELIQANELRTQLLVRTANVGLWDWDLLTNRVYFSREWKMQLGYAEDELTNHYEEWESRLHPDDRDAALTAVREFRAGIRTIYDVEFRLRHKDGSWRWICAHADFQRDSNGKAIRIMGCHLDITDRKNADAARTEALELLEKVASRIPGIVYQFRMRPDGTSCFPYASEGMRSLLGVGPEEVREDGAKVYARHHPDDEAGLYASIEKSKNDLTPWSHEFRFNLPDGTVRWIAGNSIPERAADGTTLWHGYMADVTERKQTEEALRRSKQDLIEAQRVAHMGSWHLDVATNNVQWSDELYRMFGFDSSLPAPPFTAHEKLFTKESWDKLSIAIAKTRDTGLPYELELEVVRTDGSSGWVWVRGIADQDANGATVSLRGVAQDITERKRTEAALKDSEGRWRFALEGGRDGVWEWNITERTVLYSKRWLEILGYEEGEVGTSAEEWKSRIHPDDLGQVMADIRAHLEGTTPSYNNEHRIQCKDGTWKWVLDRGLVISRDADGRPLRILGTHSDITEQKQAEALLRDNQALKSSAAGLRLVTTSARVGLVVVNKDHRYTFANAAYSAILNLPNDLVGKHISDVLPDAYEERVRPRLERAFTGERMDYEFRLPTASGNPTHCAVNYEPVMEGNVVTSVAIVVMDITAQRNTEEQLRQSQKMEAVGQLAGGIAHDFNNLLTIISGYTNLLLKRLTPPDPAWNFLNEISVASKRAAELTRSLLAFSHQQIRTPESVNINDVVVETLKLLERAIGEGVQISVELEPQLKQVWMDRSELSQILLNLSINARDAMQDEGKLSIQTQNVSIHAGDPNNHTIEPGEYILLTVSDTGEGMTEEVQRRIFEPFFTTKPVGKGTGLGLAMVHGIVSRSGGTIRVSSTVGKGSSFSIYLPQSNESTNGSRENSSAKDIDTGSLGNNETILLVEDDETVRGLTRTILKHFGYHVIEAASGQAALDIFVENRSQIQMVITDVVMPGMNGIALIEQIQKLQPGIPILMISGYVGESLTREQLLDSKVSFLQKPFDPNVFAEKVRELLDQRTGKPS